MDLRSIAAGAANIIWTPISSTFSKIFSFLTGCFWNPASSDDVSFEGKEMEILHPTPEPGAPVSFAPPSPIPETPAGKLQKEFIRAKINFLNTPRGTLHESEDNKNLILLFIQVHVEEEHQSKLIEKLEQVPPAQYLWIAQRLVDAEPTSRQINHIYILNVISKYIPHSISRDIIDETRRNNPASRRNRHFNEPKNPISIEKPETGSSAPTSPVIKPAHAVSSDLLNDTTGAPAVTATNSFIGRARELAGRAAEGIEHSEMAERARILAEEAGRTAQRIAESEIAGRARGLAGRAAEGIEDSEMAERARILARKATRAARRLWNKMH